ncbi:MAG: CoA pyrophosphatase [Bacteroidetes bacterium]|nr:CoA pyrophosphatase [Bacteroidota bacterium]
MITHPELFFEKLQVRLSAPLPGKVAHDLARAVPDAIARKRFSHDTPPKAGGVLILLQGSKESLSFPLILRTDYGGTHSGQVSLPGGKVEPSEEPPAAAIRETMEEIGIPSDRIKMLGGLTPFHVIPSNFMVHPFVGWLPGPGEFNPDPREVKQILSMNLMDLMLDQALGVTEINASGYTLKAPHFIAEGQIVWGATAMILSEFRQIVKEVINGQPN